ncbi:LEA type 2 family protein [Gammaproteobacteria bacterium AB-CW1]|uniref:LEA type 2 family protein n=1 Tax=Natronospira elongata TaxID=3110268 RepID=A0AAP6JGF0_9GAMM|nr:LEA type 2 family protein [Gammaproteobacteria bacterium AB-CW1]
MNNRKLLGLMLLTLWLLGSCAHLERVVKAPEVALKELRLESVSLSRQRIAVVMDVTNTNAFRLPVREIAYDLQLMDTPLASGVMDEGISLPAGATETVTLSLETDLISTSRGLLDWLRDPGEEIAYRVEGHILPDMGLSDRLPYRHSGTVKVQMPFL